MQRVKTSINFLITTEFSCLGQCPSDAECEEIVLKLKVSSSGSVAIRSSCMHPQQPSCMQQAWHALCVSMFLPHCPCCACGNTCRCPRSWHAPAWWSCQTSAAPPCCQLHCKPWTAFRGGPSVTDCFRMRFQNQGCLMSLVLHWPTALLNSC